jgi:sporadic carbohydrate cluster 2OG-Fe(II) oxygenase
MAVVAAFVAESERKASDEFERQGYLIRDVDNRPALDALRAFVVEAACRQLDCKLPNDHGAFLDHIHEMLPVEKLNMVRLSIYRSINEQSWFRPTYFALGRSVLELLVGNELAMQNRVNLSIQMPDDDSSLLDLHADVFGGETPFQVVQWLPLVDVHDTKGMFILPRQASASVTASLREFETAGMRALFDSIKSRLVWLSVPYGKVLVFTPNCLHGNVVNRVPTTRWSMNCRFTGLFTPYTSPEKKLGSFYLPITTRAVTRIGLDYKEPAGFEE